MKTNRAGMAVLGVWLALGATGALADGRASARDWDGAVSWKRPPAESSAAPAASAPVYRSEYQSPAASESGGWNSWLGERLSLGLSLSRVHLTASHRPPDIDNHSTFVGYLNCLELEDEIAVAPVVTYWIARNLRASVTWERIEARAFNYLPDDPYGHHGPSDGILGMSGPVAMLELTFPCLDDTLFPHVGGGMFYSFSYFHEDKFWHLNYNSVADWEADGSRETAPRRIYREIHVDDALGWVASAGLAWRPVKHFEVDLGVRQTWIEADCEFGYSWRGTWKTHRHGDFTLDNLAWGLTASFVF